MSLPAILLSVLGLVPFVVCGLGALSPHGNADTMLAALISWAALVLAFIGGAHWGFMLRDSADAASHPRWPRVALSAVPLVIAWIAMLLPLAAPSWLVLLLLIALYLGTVLLEHRVDGLGLLPPGYIWLRWGFTLVAVAMLTTVATLRMLGQTIAF